jgi:alpha-N-arabinofuranosidase
MAEAVIILDSAFVVGKTDPRLFGSFVEHLGRCVYGGIFEPGHPTADDGGCGKMCWSWSGSLGLP